MNRRSLAKALIAAPLCVGGAVAASGAAGADENSWSSFAPESPIPLSDWGKKKYTDFCRALFSQGRLTEFTAMMAASAAYQIDDVRHKVIMGQDVSAIRLTQMDRSLKNLNIAETELKAAPTESRARL